MAGMACLGSATLVELWLGSRGVMRLGLSQRDKARLGSRGQVWPGSFRHGHVGHGSRGQSWWVTTSSGMSWHGEAVKVLPKEASMADFSQENGLIVFGGRDGSIDFEVEAGPDHPGWLDELARKLVEAKKHDRKWLERFIEELIRLDDKEKTQEGESS